MYIVGGYIRCSYPFIALILFLDDFGPKCTAAELYDIAEKLPVKYYSKELVGHSYQLLANTLCLLKGNPFYPCLADVMNRTLFNPDVCIHSCLQLSQKCKGCLFEWFRCGITKCPKCADALSNELYIKQDYTDCSVCWGVECSRFAAACEGPKLMPPSKCLDPNPYCL